MAQLLLIAHAPMASALMAAGLHTYPECAQRMAAVDVPPGDSIETAGERIRDALRQLGAGETLMLVDAFGATPSNAALAVADGLNQRIVAGVNAPMVWRCLCYCARPLSDLVDIAIAGGRDGVRQVAAAPQQNQKPVACGHDQVQHHHQQ